MSTLALQAHHVLASTPRGQLNSSFRDGQSDELFQHFEYPAAWPVVIVDDDNQVQQVTRMVLENESVLGRPLELIDASSAEQAKDILGNRTDIVLALVDAVMESDDAGVQVAEFVRKELANASTQLVMRTGYPGKVNESLSDLGFDDYCEKATLTDRRLCILVHKSIRNYVNNRFNEEQIGHLMAVNNELRNWNHILSKEIRQGLLQIESQVDSAEVFWNKLLQDKTQH